MKTIADLKINWIFDFDYYGRVIELFRKENPSICDLKIIKNLYEFKIRNLKIEVQSDDNDTLSNLIWKIDHQVFSLQEDCQLPKYLILDRFELTAENKFTIHVKS